MHWEDVDEDLSYEGFFDKRETTQLYKVFMAHPELNVSAIARRLGISQSLMAQYIDQCGNDNHPILPILKRNTLVYNKMTIWLLYKIPH